MNWPLILTAALLFGFFLAFLSSRRSLHLRRVAVEKAWARLSDTQIQAQLLASRNDDPDALHATQNKILYLQNTYRDVVELYNLRLHEFPHRLFAPLLNHSPIER